MLALHVKIGNQKEKNLKVQNELDQIFYAIYFALFYMMITTYVNYYGGWKHFIEETYDFIFRGNSK